MACLHPELLAEPLSWSQMLDSKHGSESGFIEFLKVFLEKKGKTFVKI